MKETDRLAAMATELRKLGAAGGGGRGLLRDHAAARTEAGRTIDTYDDHRMAMSFSLAALGGVPVRINDPECVAKTFPDYFTALRERSSSVSASPSSRSTVPRPRARARSRAGWRETLGFHYLESGALYRLVALLALRPGPLDEAARSPQLAEELDVASRRRRILLRTRTSPSRSGREDGRRPRLARSRRCRPVRQALLSASAAFRQAARPGGRRPRHGDRRVPRCDAQGVLDSEPGSRGPNGAISS